jgi:hypothetical protein
MGCEKTWRRLHSTLISMRDETSSQENQYFRPIMIQEANSFK